MNVEFNSLSRMMALKQVFIVVLIRNYRSDNNRWFYDGSENIHQYARHTRGIAMVTLAVSSALTQVGSPTFSSRLSNS